jgi:hypothetical protein
MGGGIDPRASALAKVQAPAICLMVVAGISIVVRVILLVLQMVGVGVGAAAAAQQGGGDEAAFAAGQMVGGLVGMIIGIVINALTLYGGLKMKQLEQHGLAMTAAVLAVIPCCSPCIILGIPFGIWALIVLNDAEVKAAFR